MRQLVIETATEALSVALFDGDRCVDHFHAAVGRGHAEQLLPRIAALPDGGHADSILVDTGPGSFTGVRVGLAAARALAYGWHVPVSGYSTLAIVALAAQSLHRGDDPLTIVMNGGHGELFWQQYDSKSLAPLTSATSTPTEDLARQLDSEWVYGSGAQACVAARKWGYATALIPDARDAVRLPPALVHQDASAFYGRGADAMTIAQRKATAK